MRAVGQPGLQRAASLTASLSAGFPKLALPVNTTVRARVQFKQEHANILLLLCGEEHCSRVQLWGVLRDGALAYVTSTGVPISGWLSSSSQYSVSEL